DVTLAAVSRAPLAKVQAYKRRMGWSFPWASSSGSDFNADFNASFTEEQQREGGIEYNYRREPAWQLRSDEGMASRMPGTPVGDNAAMTGTDPATYTRERPGMSAFVLEDGVVYHTYSTYARGLDGLWGMYQWLDRAPNGRHATGAWWRRRAARRTARGRCGHANGRRSPVHRVEGASPRLLPGGRARPRAGRCRRGLATRAEPRPPLRQVQCRSDGDPLGSRGDGPARDG